MDEEQIKTLRHSFTNPHREDLPKPKVNKFGHTVLGDEMQMADQEIELKINDLGDVSADPKQSVFDSPQFQKWAEKQPNTKTSDLDLEEAKDRTSQNQTNIVPNSVSIADLISELDEMDGTAERRKAENHQMKRCANENCLYALPLDAKFCLKCGTAQLPKFCTECGFKFPGMEKFCPDCGNKR